MAQPALVQREPVVIIESTHFSEDVKNYWSLDELDGARYLFAARKAPGVSSKDYPGLRELTFAGAVVIYGVDENFDKVFLVHIYRVGATVQNISFRDRVIKLISKVSFFYLTYEKIRKPLGLPDLRDIDFPDIGDLF